MTEVRWLEEARKEDSMSTWSMRRSGRILATAVRASYRSVVALAMTWTLLSSVLSSFAVAQATEEPRTATSGNVATRWVEQSFDAVRAGNPGLHTGTPCAGRTYAMTTAAMYDAVNGIEVAEGVSRRGRALIGSYEGAPAGASREAAASAAAHAVLTSLFASRSASLDEMHAAELEIRARAA